MPINLVPQDYQQPGDTQGKRKKVRPEDIRSGTLYGQYQLRGSILTIKDASTTASGYMAFGTDMTTIPTSATTGTGVYVDYTGIYGLSSGTQNFVLDANGGSITAISGTIGGWTITSTELRNSGSTVKLRGAGNLAFGSTPPTSATVGTGIFIDNTGIYGLASNVQQAYMLASNGKVVAGAGDVTLDTEGISIVTGTGNKNKIKWKNGSNVIGQIFSNNSVTGTVQIDANLDSSLSESSMWLTARDSSDYTAIEIYAAGADHYAVLYRGNSGATLAGFKIADAYDASAPLSLLHLSSTAPTFRMQDLTSSAESLLLTVDGNKAEFRSVSSSADDLVVLDLSNARVGIGTASPSATLDVNGAAKISSDLTVDTNTFYVDATNNRVGIGTAAPYHPFHIVSAASTDSSLKFNQVIQTTTAYDANPTGGIQFWNKYKSDGTIAGMGGISVGKENSTDANLASFLSLHTRPAGGEITERVRVSSDGGLGILDGISAPATKSGWAYLYVDSADGDLKVKFGDGTVKTIVTDT